MLAQLRVQAPPDLSSSFKRAPAAVPAPSAAAESAAGPNLGRPPTSPSRDSAAAASPLNGPHSTARASTMTGSVLDPHVRDPVGPPSGAGRTSRSYDAPPDPSPLPPTSAPPDRSMNSLHPPPARIQPQRQASCDLPLNPLFGMGEQIRVKDASPPRLLVQRGIILRDGHQRSRSRTPIATDAAKRNGNGMPGLGRNGSSSSKERPRRPDDHDEHWHDRLLAKAHEWGLAGALSDDDERGHTLYLPVPAAAAAVAQSAAQQQTPAAVGNAGARPNGDADGYADHVHDFREEEEKQDHYDAARMKLQSLHGEVHEMLENAGFRTPVSERHQAVMSPKLDHVDGDRPPSRATASSVQHQPSFHSATSEIAAPDTGQTAADVPDLSVIPPRTESPLSFNTLSEVAASTPTVAPIALPNGAADPAGSEQEAPRPASRRDSNASRLRTPSPRLPPPVDGDAGLAAMALGPRVRRSSRPSRSPPRHAAGIGGVGPSPSQSFQAMHDVSPAHPASNSLRSMTVDSAYPPTGVDPVGSASLPLAARRMSTASATPRSFDMPPRLVPPSLAPRSQSFSPGTPVMPADQQFPPEASGSGPLPGTSPTTSVSYPPVGMSTPPVLFDDVESSIAAQADVIRRQRQEKRLEAEREQAKRDRQLERDRVAGAKKERQKSEGSLAPPIEDKLPSGPGALIRRRVTRMGSGSSQPDANGQAHAREASAQSRDESTGRRGRGGSGREDDRAGLGVLVGNLIGQDHANYVLMYNMLTGIRIGVSRCQAKAKRPLTDADYTARHKFSFDIVGNELTPSVKYDFKFKDYAPWVFRELREYFYLDPSDYLISLTAKYILSELGSPGKSGSFFYFSRDYRFIIKTIRHSEHKFLRRILKDYHEHVKKNPHTLLSRFYGLHRVKLPRGRKIHFVVMNNLFPPHRDIHETYDLKGSAIGRLYPEEKARQNPHATLKDLNWVQRHRQFWLGPEKKVLFEEQLRRDTELLQRLGIMDYSLLTGIHNLFKGNSEGLREDKLTVFQPDAVKVSRKATQVKRDADASAVRKAVERSDPQALGGEHELPQTDSSERRLFIFYQDEGGMRASDDNDEEIGVIYYLGIIDILTPYTLVKRLEHFFRGLKHNKHMISAVHPREYGDRFLAFIKSSIRGNDESLRPPMYEHGKEPDSAGEKPAGDPSTSEQASASAPAGKVKVQ